MTVSLLHSPGIRISQEPYCVATMPEPGVTLVAPARTLAERYADATGFAPESFTLQTGIAYTYLFSAWVDIAISGPGSFLGRTMLTGGQILDTFTLQQLETAEGRN